MRKDDYKAAWDFEQSIWNNFFYLISKMHIQKCITNQNIMINMTPKNLNQYKYKRTNKMKEISHSLPENRDKKKLLFL